MKKLGSLIEGLAYLIIVFLLWEIMSFGYAYIIDEFGSHFSEGVILFFNAAGSYIYIMAGWIFGLTLIFFLRKLVNKTPLFFGEYRKLRFPNAMMAALCGFGAVFIVNSLIGLFNQYYEINIFLFDTSPKINSMIQSIIILGILFPLFEEILFRGFILTKLLDTYSDTSAIILSSAIFALSHMELIRGIYAFAIGLLAGYSVTKTKTIKSAVIIHMTYNLCNLYFHETDMDSYLLSQMIAFLVFGIFLIWFAAGKLQKDKIVYRNRKDI